MSSHEVRQEAARIPLAEGQWTALLFFEPDVVPITIEIPVPLPPFIDVGLAQQAGLLAGPRGAPLTKAAQRLRLQQVYASAALRITFYASETVCERIRAVQAERQAAAPTDAPATTPVPEAPPAMNGHVLRRLPELPASDAPESPESP